METLIALSLVGLVAGSVTYSFMFIMRSTGSMGNYIDMNSQSRNGLEYFSRDMRMAVDVLEIKTSSIKINIVKGDGTLETIEYKYDSVKGQFQRITDAGVFAVLKDVEKLTITCYNILDTATVDILEAKNVQLDAEMVRSIFQISNTNNVVSARFMMRNRNVSS